MEQVRSQRGGVLGAWVLGAWVLGAAVPAGGVLSARGAGQAPARPAQTAPAPAQTGGQPAKPTAPPGQPARPTPPASPPQRTVQMPTLPLTQLDDSALAGDFDNRTFALTFAQALPVKDLLLLLVRGTNLSIIPDPDIAGSFIGDLKNVTVRQALALILPPLGLDYRVEASAIRVFRRQPETRIFAINYIAAERSGESLVAAPATHPGGSDARVGTRTTSDLFGEISRGVQTLLSEKATFNVDRKAGLLQVTDVPERLDRVALYLDAVLDRVRRQVQIEARVVEVELSDPAAPGLDWAALAQGRGAAAGRRPLTTGLRITDVAAFITALGAQGKVSTLANPRLLALNNEPALVHSDALTLSVTPQIASDGVVMLSLTPIVAGPQAREADTLARVGDGETLVVSGFTADREIREKKNVGLTGGWFGRSTVVTKKRIETLILLTPRILVSTTN